MEPVSLHLKNHEDQEMLIISSLFVFQVIEFSPEAIAAFIAMVGILSIIAQVGLGLGLGG